MKLIVRICFRSCLYVFCFDKNNVKLLERTYLQLVVFKESLYLLVWVCTFIDFF